MRLRMKSAETAAIPRCLVLRIVPCCLPQPKMLLGHLSAGLRDLIADVTGGARIDRAPAPLAGLGEAVVLRDARRHADLAQRRNVVAGVVSLVLTDGDAL